jgi:hypothetical protein
MLGCTSRGHALIDVPGKMPETARKMRALPKLPRHKLRPCAISSASTDTGSIHEERSKYAVSPYSSKDLTARPPCNLTGRTQLTGTGMSLAPFADCTAKQSSTALQCVIGHGDGCPATPQHSSTRAPKQLSAELHRPACETELQPSPALQQGWSSALMRSGPQVPSRPFHQPLPRTQTDAPTHRRTDLKASAPPPQSAGH